MATFTTTVDSDARTAKIATVESQAFLSTAGFWSLRNVFQLGSPNAFAIEHLRGYLRSPCFYAGQTLPFLGLVLQAADEQFTQASHTYTATCTPRKTADDPTPTPTFQDRPAVFFNRAFDKSPVLAVPWNPSGLDLPAAGFYDLRFKAVNNSTGRSFPLPSIEIKVLEAI